MIYSGFKVIETTHSSSKTEVVRATQISDHQQYILKVRKNQLSESEKVGLIHEYDIVKSIESDRIPDYISLIHNESVSYLIMKDSGMINLESQIPEKGFETDDFLTLAISIATSLEEIHNSDIIHKNITPSNIIINRDLTSAMIIDFDSASKINEEIVSYQSPGTIPGSMSYISPEQTGRLNRSVDYRTDLYSLGIVFYKLLTGALPFESDDNLKLIHLHLAKQPQPPHRLKKEIPQILSDIVLKLLSKNADERYKSLQGLKKDLRFCQNKSYEELTDFSIGLSDFSKKFTIPQKLYGREQEISLLHKQFDRVCKRDTLVTLITGHSGIGKTSIVKELQKEITIQDAYFGAGKYEHLKKNIAYSAISQVFTELIRQILGESNERVDMWRINLQKAVGSNGQVIIDIIPDLELLLGSQPPVATMGSNETLNRFNSVFQNFVSVFDQLAHPLVIFLDDLQWIDLASLKLIKLITAGHLTKSFFFIGAYRDNEVDESHPAIVTIEEIKKTGVDIEYINLKPLNYKYINTWASETLLSTLKETEKLASMIINKTNGNPFFVKSFLQRLYKEGLVRLSEKFHWQWNINEILTAEPADNVQDLMVRNISSLPSDSIEIITLASCIGNIFDIRTLSVISKIDVSKVLLLLQPLLAAGMIFKSGETYKFIHDKILEAAYSQISEDKKSSVHLQIGKLLLHNYRKNELETNTFAIAEHLNKGISLINNQSEKYELIELNLHAAQKAKKSTAYKSARNYYASANSLLPENAWESDYALTLEIHSEWAEAEYMSTNYEKAEQLFDLILEKAKTILEKARIYQMILVHCENTRHFREAVELSLKIMSQLQIPYPRPEEISTAMKEKQKNRFFNNIDKSKISSISQLPEVRDVVYREAIGTLVSVMVPYWNTYPDELTYLSYEIVNLSIEHGLCSTSSLGFSMLGSILISDADYVDLGFELAKLAIDIAERFHDKFHAAAVKYMFYNHVHFWKKPLKWKMDCLIEAYHSGLESGNNQWASYCLNHYSMRHLLAGTNLQQTKSHYDKFINPMYRLRQGAALTYFNPPRQTVDNFLGFAESHLVLKGDAFDENIGIPEFYETKQFSAIGLAFICKLLLFVVFGEYKQALDIVLTEKSEEYIRASTSQYQPYTGLCLYGITMMQNYNQVSGSEQKRFLKKAIDLADEFEGYVDIYEDNFIYIYEILLAEINRIKGNLTEAIDYYDKAIKSAEKNGFLHFCGIANELAASFWEDRGKKQIAYGYIRHAYEVYKEWGSEIKLKQISEKYHFLIQNQQGFSYPATSLLTKSSSEMDLDTVIKATRTISGEIIIDKLLGKLVQIIIENAGAQKGYIILEKKGELFIEAGFDIEVGDGTIFHEEPLEGTSLLSESMVHFVIRSGENINLNNAVASEQFSKDPYIIANKSKSILVLPIIFQDVILGVLFLENDLISDAFTEHRIELLNIILSQAAISIENARLFEAHQQAEETLRQSESKFRTLYESSIDAIILLDPEKGYFDCNPAALKMFSIPSKKELYKLSPDKLSPVFQPEGELSKEISGKYITKSLKEGTASFDWIHKGIDGREFPTRVLINKIEIDGKTILQGTIRDITKRKEAENRLLSFRNYLSEIINSMPSAIIGINDDGIVTQWNSRAEESTGVNQENAIGKKITEAIPRLSTHFNNIQNAISKNENYICPKQSYTNGGRTYFEDITAYPLQEEQGSVIRLDDVTDRIQLEKLMIQNEKMNSVGGLAAGMAHEINNPLAAITQGIQNILRRIEPSSKQNRIYAEKYDIDISKLYRFLSDRKIIRFLTNGQDAVEKAAGIVKNMLLFSRKSDSVLSRTNMKELVDYTIELGASDYDMKKKYDFKFVDIIKEYDTDIPMIKCCQSEIEQVLLNIFKNSLQAMEEITGTDYSPQFCIRMLREQEFIRIEIIDNGPGISEDVKHRIFEPFFTTKPVGVGTGLGLSVSYMIITQNHGGTFEVESEIGKGAKFIIRLPINS